MPFLIHEKSVYRKVTEDQYFLNQMAHILAYDKAVFDNESFLKSSFFEFLAGLVSLLG